MTEPTEPNVGSAVVYLMVGLPGAGKTYRAKELEISASALRLTPDEWQIALFGDQNPPDKRDLVEGKLVQLGMRAAELGVNVVLDFGFWSKDERSALRWIAGTVGARSQVGYRKSSRPTGAPDLVAVGQYTSGHGQRAEAVSRSTPGGSRVDG